MDDSISRQKAINATESLKKHYDGRKLDFEIIGYNIALNDVKDAILGLPSEESERKIGKWLEKEVICTSEDGFALQSCKCSVCERYDTRPYMYYFSEPRFCSWCGALNGEIKEGGKDA
jgi:hypothetical protein